MLIQKGRGVSPAQDRRDSHISIARLAHFSQEGQESRFLSKVYLLGYDAVLSWSLSSWFVPG